jgi:hypothetical protein
MALIHLSSENPLDCVADEVSRELSLIKLFSLKPASDPKAAGAYTSTTLTSPAATANQPRAMRCVSLSDSAALSRGTTMRGRVGI